MADAEGRCATAPILDHHLHLAKALLLSDDDDDDGDDDGDDDDDDDDVDAQLLVAAREYGIEDPHLILVPPSTVLDISTAISTLSLSSEPRSSLSVHSRETHSTTLTSIASRHSRDKSPMSRLPPPLARASFSVDRHPGPSNPPLTPKRHRHSLSASTSMALSTPFSMRPCLSQKPKRASALLSLFRHHHCSHCPSQSYHRHYFKPQSSRLECGHSLSKHAIRVHVQEALEQKGGAAPACCGYPLPRHVLAIVLTNAEVDLVTDSILPLPVQIPCRDSAYSEDSMSSAELPLVMDTHSVSESTWPPTPTMQLNEEETARLDSALSSEAFHRLRTRQREQFRRVLALETKQKRALLLHHQTTLDRLMALYENSEIEKKHQHVQQLEYLDESQLRAEHGLRETHHAETRNVATALKHMEAYCLGPSPTRPGISYTVTEQDQKKLEHQRMIQGKLPIKHESAINVLRAKQERDTLIKMQKQQAELYQLQKDYQNTRRVQEERYENDCHRLDARIQKRRSRVLHRWDLRFEIWRRWWQKEYATTLIGNIPHEHWPIS